MAASSGRSKRVTKRSVSPSANSAAILKKKKVIPAIDELEDNSNSPTSFVCNQYNQCVFKDPNFEHSGVNSSKKRLWKNLKQIIALERTLPWQQDDPTYSSMEAPPSFKPAKKYCDLTGFPAKYKDPETRMLYSTSEEFLKIRNLTMDIVGGYLTLRKAAPT